jgi:hypothetical protein
MTNSYMFYYISNFAFVELKKNTKISLTKFGHGVHLEDLPDNFTVEFTSSVWSTNCFVFFSFIVLFVIPFGKWALFCPNVSP